MVVLVIMMQAAQLLFFFFKVIDDIVHKTVDIHISVTPLKVVDVVGLSYLEQLVDDVWRLYLFYIDFENEVYQLGRLGCHVWQ